MVTGSSLTSALHLLRPFRSDVDAIGLTQAVHKAWRQLRRGQIWKKVAPLFNSQTFKGLSAESTDLTGDILLARLSPTTCDKELEEIARLILPWRIGPIQLGNVNIDSEWLSHKKWNRLLPLLPQEQGRKIADIGCSNGYFLFKMAEALRPCLALGFDPVERCWLQFHLLQKIFTVPNTSFLPVGLDALSYFKNFFDLTVCMGVLYHQRDPYEATRTLVNATAPGGTVVVESLSIDTELSVMLIPKERYAKMRNAWMIPSPLALAHLLERAGCTEVQIHRLGPITTSEQRRTTFAPYESLSDFLDPQDPSKTIEGYPAPHSTVVTGIRKA